MTTSDPLQWEKGTRILVILAHPDDPEFFLGATIAKWVSEGHDVRYGLLTHGERGVSPAYPTGDVLVPTRFEEQKRAAKVLGVEDIHYFDYPDGYLVPDLEMRKAVARFIRKMRPQIVVGCDPLNYYSSGTYLNHPDHRAAGQILVDSVFPAVGNPSFFPEFLDEGLEPLQLHELWLSLPVTPNIELDVDDFYEQKITALLEHRSQIGEPEQFRKNMMERRITHLNPEGRYQESFRRLVFRR